jgi:hypothetical protein
MMMMIIIIIWTSADQMSVASDTLILASELGKPPPLAV